MTCWRTCQDTSDTPCTWSQLTGSKWVPQDYCQVHFIVRPWLRNHTSVARESLVSAPQPSAMCVCLSFNVWACLDGATFKEQVSLGWKNTFEVCGKEITSQNKLLGLDENEFLNYRMVQLPSSALPLQSSTKAMFLLLLHMVQCESKQNRTSDKSAHQRVKCVFADVQRQRD